MNVTESFFIGVSAIAIILIGFSGVIIALGCRGESRRTPSEMLQLRTLVESSIVSLTLKSFPAVTGTSLIITQLKNSMKHEFDGELEVIRSELKSKETQIESLRSGAMSELITRQGALYQRKIQ
ncbi:MAG: hypothetical protein V7708_04645 [Oceanicoccus sp.]